MSDKPSINITAPDMGKLREPFVEASKVVAALGVTVEEAGQAFEAARKAAALPSSSEFIRLMSEACGGKR